MRTGTIVRTGPPAADEDDPLCFHFWKCDSAAYFEYLRSPESLSFMFDKPTSIGCGIEAAIESISKAPTPQKG